MAPNPKVEANFDKLALPIIGQNSTPPANREHLFADGRGKLGIWDLSPVIRGNTASNFSTWRRRRLTSTSSVWGLESSGGAAESGVVKGRCCPCWGEIKELTPRRSRAESDSGIEICGNQTKVSDFKSIQKKPLWSRQI